ncbi:MAG: cytochrome c [Desulfobacteraceae bacterium]|jgi:mono/diheme cytochrome c family protein
MQSFTIKQYEQFVVLCAVLFLFSASPSNAAAQDAEALYKQKCLSCHAVSPAKKVSINERASSKGMPLWFAGSKFNKEWLETWLASPQPIFGVKWGSLEKGAYNHPAVDASEAKPLAEYLMTLVDDQVKAGTTAPLPKSRGKRKSFLGRTAQLFEKHQGCYACHRYLNKRNQELGGFSGPSLVKASERLQSDWVYAFLKDPRRYYPNGSCPIPGDMAFNKFTDENRAAIATYIVNIGTR